MLNDDAVACGFCGYDGGLVVNWCLCLEWFEKAEGSHGLKGRLQSYCHDGEYGTSILWYGDYGHDLGWFSLNSRGKEAKLKRSSSVEW